ncbi:glycosyl transferase family protein [Sphingomonas sp. AOB5]|uniref:glycosyl transferase family protein n=1 Tax=Sphingomonas sp. AOB5 TaxID=3034017 RepID=UPI0023F8ED86|nr:glycosyl transferase family protein [Sphingomonas sp. AOB5]MDF7776076.1 glycosyl transferase family protein [Sphingomonas sp. AOB5]
MGAATFIAAGIIAGIDAIAREATLFAAIWFLAGGIDDLMVDLVYGWRRLQLWWRGPVPEPVLPPATAPGRIAIFVPAWDESRVIGAMLGTALARFDYPDYRIFVGTYPNDPATIDAVAAIAEHDSRVRLVIGPNPGPTTKADCLNALWRALLRDEARDGERVMAIALHDAEDMVHRLELRVFAHELNGYDAVQLPVMPLRKAGSPLVSGHYCDEFAEAHAKQMPVRQTLRAGLPFAGTGCAIRREMIGRIADVRGGAPFDAESLTEDYELGLTIAAMGGRTVFTRTPEAPGGPPVAVRAYFPDRFDAAAKQKARWMTGIALAGWDRTGWSRAGAIGDHWMRMRDRRAILEIPVLALAYLALATWALSLAGHIAMQSPLPAYPAWIGWLLGFNFALLGWRVAIRTLFVTRAYGWREARWSPLRLMVGNMVALAAARLAMLRYLAMLAGAVPQWDKTEHDFPEDAELAAG